MVGRDLLDVNTRGFNFLLNPKLVDVDMLNLRVKLLLLLGDNTNSLLIITPDRRWTIELKINAVKESHLLLYL